MSQNFLRHDRRPMPSGRAPAAVIGTGVIGRSWGAVFIAAGVEARLFDSDSTSLAHAVQWLHEALDSAVRDGALTSEDADARRHLIRRCQSLSEALDGAGYAQESGPEEIETKREMYAILDASAEPNTILASSTSAHDMTEIAAGLPERGDVVAHPVNPPHVVPVVEVLPGRQTTSAVVDATIAFLTEVGQQPVRLNRYAPGFLLNRMQAALVREAIHLVESGVADVAAVDTVIRDGLGLRWALLGPFGVANTNADGGIRQYLQMYGDAFRAIMADLGPTPSFEPEMIERLARQTDHAQGAATIEEVIRWRDRSIARIRQLRDDDPHPSHRDIAPPDVSTDVGGNGSRHHDGRDQTGATNTSEVTH